jgi:hypothetical protein
MDEEDYWKIVDESNNHYSIVNDIFLDTFSFTFEAKDIHIDNVNVLLSCMTNYETALHKYPTHLLIMKDVVVSPILSGDEATFEFVITNKSFIIRYWNLCYVLCYLTYIV